MSQPPRPLNLHPQALPTENRARRVTAIATSNKQSKQVVVRHGCRSDGFVKRGVRCIRGVVFISVQYYNSMCGVSELETIGTVVEVRRRYALFGKQDKHGHETDQARLDHI